MAVKPIFNKDIGAQGLADQPWRRAQSGGRGRCVSGIAEGNYHEMDGASEAFQKADRSVASAYVAKSGMSEKDAIDLMDKTTYLTADEAVKLKLVDRVMFQTESPQQLAASASGLLPRAAADKIRSLLNEKKIQTELNFLKEKVI